MDKATMKQTILNRWLNEQGITPPTPAAMADMALEALDTILALNYGTVTFEASEEAVNKVLAAAVTDDGRSNFMWLVTPGDGDVMLGVFPRGFTYEDTETLREEDYKRAMDALHKCPAPDGPCTCTNGIGCINTPLEDW